MFPHIEQIIMLEITECVEMETDEDGHYLGTAHRPLALPVLTPIRLWYRHFRYFLVIFFAKIIDNTKNFSNFVLGNLHNDSILCL